MTAIPIREPHSGSSYVEQDKTTMITAIRKRYLEWLVVSSVLVFAVIGLTGNLNLEPYAIPALILNLAQAVILVVFLIRKWSRGGSS